jgi:hypothetical protein
VFFSQSVRSIRPCRRNHLAYRFVIKGENGMDFNKVEALEIERTINETDAAVRELGELELALVGGGMGDMILG